MISIKIFERKFEMKKILTLILVALLLVSVFPLNAFALPSSGSAGENSEFEYDSNTGTVIVRPIDLSKEATIEMPTLCSELCIKHVVIEEGITRIESSAFYSCDNLEDVIIKEGTTTIDTYAFAQCDNLKLVDMPSTLARFGSGVFSHSPVTTLVFRGPAVNIEDAVDKDGLYGDIKVYTSGGWVNINLNGKYGYTFYKLSEYTGTMQSYGSVWIIAGVSVVALAAVTFVLGKKKHA